MEGCDAKVHAHGFCPTHHSRWKRHGDPLAGGPLRQPKGTCSVDGCEKSAPMNHGYGDRLCGAHALRWKTHGDVQADKPLQGQWTNLPCRVDGCERPARGRGLCAMHYARWLKSGEVGSSEPQRIIGDDEARFWSYVDRNGPMAPNGLGRCWQWTGTTLDKSRNPGDGWLYGSFTFGTAKDRTATGAHRYSYKLANGPIADGLLIHHVCENTLCVNPAHLEAVTPAEHITKTPDLHKARAAHAAKLAARTTCSKGHSKAVYGHHDGRQWVCRECRRLAELRRLETLDTRAKPH